jgi:hypothetical protein
MGVLQRRQEQRDLRRTGRELPRVRQAARAKGDVKSLVGLELGLRAYGRFLEGPVPRGFGSAVVGGGVSLMAGAAVLYLFGAYVVEALLAF